jgi:hypothetical protein
MHRKDGLEDGKSTRIVLKHHRGTERVLVWTQGDASIGFACWVAQEVNKFFLRHGMKEISIHDLRVLSVEDGARLSFEITVPNCDLPKKAVGAGTADPFWEKFHDSQAEIISVYRKIASPLRGVSSCGNGISLS